MSKDDTIRALEREVQELKEGACRYNCRTAKESWVAGFLAANKHTEWEFGSEFIKKVANDEWKKRQKSNQ